MNKLPFETKRLLVNLMVEGATVRGIARTLGIAATTVLRYVELAGTVCAAFHDENVRNVPAGLTEFDEAWGFVFSKDRNTKQEYRASGERGSCWVWNALAADSKLIVSYYVGARSVEAANEFVSDFANRIEGTPHISSDGFSSYVGPIEDAFGWDCHYGQVIKIFSETPDRGPARKYSPGICTGIKKHRVIGNPIYSKISTSYVESYHQKLRQHVKRLGRLTAAHSKKLANHAHAISLYVTYYNWVRIHQSLRVTPAMAAGLTDRLMEIDDIVRMIEAYEGQPKKRGPYKKRAAT